MRSRDGFVSNSSGSSFIIAGKNLDRALFLRHTLAELDLITEKATTKEELDKYFADNLESHEDLVLSIQENPKKNYYKKDWLDNYNKALECIGQGKTIYFGYCSDQGGNVISAGLVGGGWEDMQVDPEFEYEVIKDCSGY
jgi:hypothetical protein